MIRKCGRFFYSTNLYRFAVSFVPAEPCEHVINVSFNKMPVPGCPISVNISGGMSGPQVSLGGPGPVHLPNSLMINHTGGRLEDIEVNVEGKFFCCSFFFKTFGLFHCIRFFWLLFFIQNFFDFTVNIHLSVLSYSFMFCT